MDRCKGSRDLSPEEMRRFRHIEEVFSKSCLQSGYEEVKTPTLEYLHLFTATGTLTPGLLGRVYSFLDWDGWSGERVVLRPDGTIPVARFFTESMAERKLARLFYLANIFAFEPTGTESREKWQCGAELIGGASPLADVELIMLATEVLQKLALKGIELKVSHAGMVRAILKNLGLSAEESMALFERILDGDTGALSGLKAKPEVSNMLSLLLEQKWEASGFLKNMRALFNHVPELEPHLENFITVLENLDALGCRYQIDLTTGRSLEYYTGLMFQLYTGGVLVGGGGRYDALIPLLGGGDIPASGFALYIDELMRLAASGQEQQSPRILVRVSPGDRAAVREGFNVVKALRDTGYIAELDLGSNDPSDYNWLVDVQGKPPFVVFDGRRKREAGSIPELIRLLNK